ncbi:four-carbon acid sugar kinase family protein [Polycladomyces sp. WAk]|uniref:Four-carbon acid sugar kinase family protein n=1 Tax=Polycladomyces zharkentensis TaxID=2807616 RepID=A0ABS2WJH0_9BACL|nr:four-carbon acid sugar kinase family protein [Polycladomyces sp. WAk]MBN2909539.1 four-carbon acid sugar kinase family protein [Polycladomyces sp. WAk]
MRKLVVIADDITGGNATGVLLTKQGWKVLTVPDHRVSITGPLERHDAVVWNAATRLLPAEEAGLRVRRMAEQVIPHDDRPLLAKRIDSTLRGSVGMETEAVLQVMPPETIAAVVPAFPQSGRLTREGELLVHGVPVHQTEAGRDPFTPVKTSRVVDWIQSQTSLPVGLLETGKYTLAKDMRVALERLIALGYKLIVCDAESDEDIEKLAEAWAGLNLPVLPVDPGPFTAAYAAAKNAEGKRILLVSGSLAETARKQLDYLEQSLPVGMLTVNVNRLTDNAHDYTAEVAHRLKELTERFQVVGLRTDGVPANRCDGHTVSESVARLVVNLIHRYPFDGLYLSGGEVAFTTLRAMEVRGLQLMGEVLPLCVMAKLVGGPFQGMHIITKGGSVGDDAAILTSVKALLRQC